MTFDGNTALQQGLDEQSVADGQTLRDTARQVLDSVGWRLDAAVALFAAIVKDDGRLLFDLASFYLSSMERGARSAERDKMRAATVYPLPVDKTQRGHRVMALARGNALMLLDWRLPDGTKMRDATKPQLRKAAELQYKQGTTMVNDSKWYARVADNLKDDKTKVGSVLKEDMLRKLKEEASRAKR